MDSRLVNEMILQGVGIGVVSTATVEKAMWTGKLVRVLPEFWMPDFTARTIVPERRNHLARVRAFVSHLRSELAGGIKGPGQGPADVATSPPPS